jgi:hypothetical protein
MDNFDVCLLIRLTLGGAGAGMGGGGGGSVASGYVPQKL